MYFSYTTVFDILAYLQKLLFIPVLTFHHTKVFFFKLILHFLGVVTAFISSRPTSGITVSTNVSQVQKPVLVTPSQPLLLPKPSIHQKVSYFPFYPVLIVPFSQ